MSASRAVYLAVLAAAAVVAGACDVVDVVVARVGTTADGGALQSCGSDDDCAPTFYCMRRACDDMGGVCEARPLMCSDDPAFVCGCDGVIYWNDCLRQRDGVAAISADGGCTGAVPVASCATPSDCPVSNAYCNRLNQAPPPPASGPPTCALVAEGECIVLPDSCPTGQLATWHLCEHAPAPCADLCTAIQSGLPYHPPFGPDDHFMCR